MTKVFISIFFVIGVGVFSYYFGHGRGLKQALERQPIITEKIPSVLAADFIFATGGTRTELLTDDGGGVLIDIWIGGDHGLEEFWVEYGMNPEHLDRETEHETSHLGMVGRGSHGNFTRVIPVSTLQSGALYYYRAVGLRQGTKVYSGTSAFQAPK